MKWIVFTSFQMELFNSNGARNYLFIGIPYLFAKRIILNNFSRMWSGKNYSLLYLGNYFSSWYCIQFMFMLHSVWATRSLLYMFKHWLPGRRSRNWNQSGTKQNSHIKKFNHILLRRMRRLEFWLNLQFPLRQCASKSDGWSFSVIVHDSTRWYVYINGNANRCGVCAVH